MKTTFLSWCGKAGVPKELRLTLGCHSRGKDCMADLYCRDELAEPLRQLGFVMAWVIEKIFVPDLARSGALQIPPKEKVTVSRSEPNAEEYLQALCRNRDHLSETTVHATLIQFGVSTDQVESETENEAEEEDEDSDAVQERAAEVTIDSTCMPPEQDTTADKTPSDKLFAPPMPELQFTVMRHCLRGTRHWCAKGKHIICQERLCPSYDPSKYDTAITHADPFCLDCLRAAEEEYGVVSPERFAHGEQRTAGSGTQSPASAFESDVKKDRRAFLSKSIARKNDKLM